MRERSILFSGPMVRAILDGRKTVTRRIVKPQPPAGHLLVGRTISSTCVADEGKWVWSGGDNAVALIEPHRVRCPYGQPGDRLWVRETFYCDHAFYPDGEPVSCAWREIDGTRVPIPMEEQRAEMKECMFYRADGIPDFEGGESDIRWTPSIHMPRWASRITLEVTGVRVERLQDITEAQAIAEGLHRIDVGSGYGPRYTAEPARWADVVEGTADAYEDPRLAPHLWQSINGSGSWDANPWVWAVEFKRIEQERKAA